jgi:hypothetical protein
VGHYLHEKNDPTIYKQFRENPFPNEDDELVAAQISDYAKESPDEFVAEVFAAHIAGMDLNFSIDVFTMFHRYGGTF